VRDHRQLLRPWIQIDGTVQIVPFPQAMDG
jgi:hypothetical protein